jgi:hypothetical protein
VQLVAKLKSIFDRFDANSVGRLSGAQVEQMLVYMNRPVGSVQVNDWLQRLKDKEDSIEFPEFVAQYSVGALRCQLLQTRSHFACYHCVLSPSQALFAGEDPGKGSFATGFSVRIFWSPSSLLLVSADVPVGEHSAEKARSPGRGGGKSGLTDRDTADADGEHWFDREDARRGDDDEDGERRREGGTVHSRFEDKDITDLKMVRPPVNTSASARSSHHDLSCVCCVCCVRCPTVQLAELKTIFDRFAVDGAMTAPETCQALTEAGVIVPRRFAHECRA